MLSCLFLIACSSQKDVKSISTKQTKEIHVTLRNDVQFTADKKWQVDDSEGPFDLQLWHDSTYMGVMVYHLSDFTDDLNSAEKLLTFHIDDLKSKRNEFIEVELLTDLDEQENSTFLKWFIVVLKKMKQLNLSISLI